MSEDKAPEGAFFIATDTSAPTETAMPTLDLGRSALKLLAQAEHAAATGGEMTRIILNGACEVDSELIRRHLLPELMALGCQRLRFTCPNPEPGPALEAILLPLADGSAFACDIRQRWSALSPEEAKTTIAHIGQRYAPGNHWIGGFSAARVDADGTAEPLTPGETAAFWEKICAYRPAGFSNGLIDHLEAWGHAAYSHAFGDSSKLGL